MRALREQLKFLPFVLAFFAASGRRLSQYRVPGAVRSLRLLLCSFSIIIFGLNLLSRRR